MSPHCACSMSWPASKTTRRLQYVHVHVLVNKVLVQQIWNEMEIFLTVQKETTPRYGLTEIRDYSILYYY